MEFTLTGKVHNYGLSWSGMPQLVITEADGTRRYCSVSDSVVGLINSEMNKAQNGDLIRAECSGIIQRVGKRDTFMITDIDLHLVDPDNAGIVSFSAYTDAQLQEFEKRKAVQQNGGM